MFTTQNKVCASHTDANGCLKLVSALDMMQDCTHNWLDAEQNFYNYLQHNNLVMLVVSRQIDVVRLPEYGENLEVRTSIYGCRKFFGYRNTSIYDAQKRPCLKSWCTGVFCSLASGRPVKVPDEVSGTLVIDAPEDMEYLDKKIVIPEHGEAKLPPFPVRQFDIDFNQHMNNARYLQASIEFLPYQHRVSRIRIEYKNAARYGDILYPSVYQLPDKHIVVLSSANGQSYTVTEFNSDSGNDAQPEILPV